MGRKLILAPPRELTTVLTGCKMLRNVLDVAQRVDGISRQELTWLANRQREIAGLDSTTFDIVNRAIGDGRIDRAAVDRWVSGLMLCTDETAVQINRAIDAWNVLDQELAAKRPTEEAAALGDRP